MQRLEFGVRTVLMGLLMVVLFAGVTSAQVSQEHSLLLPESISDTGDTIDSLFWLIMIITGIVFVLTEGILVYFLIKYRKKEGRKAHYTHGSHKVEMIWTIIPAIVLAAIVVVQVGPWMDIKTAGGLPTDDPDAIEIHVLGKQFEWYFRYPGPDGEWGTTDDFVWNRMVVPEATNIIIRMRSLDVLHSLYFPNLRWKQDLVPGLTMSGWFKTKPGTSGDTGKREFAIACAELCGSGHHKMSGVLEVRSKDSFATWYAERGKASVDEGGIDYGSTIEFFRFWKDMKPE